MRLAFTSKSRNKSNKTKGQNWSNLISNLVLFTNLKKDILRVGSIVCKRKKKKGKREGEGREEWGSLDHRSHQSYSRVNVVRHV